jgi:hypothetical protein
MSGVLTRLILAYKPGELPNTVDAQGIRTRHNRAAEIDDFLFTLRS